MWQCFVNYGSEFEASDLIAWCMQIYALWSRSLIVSLLFMWYYCLAWIPELYQFLISWILDLPLFYVAWSLCKPWLEIVQIFIFFSVVSFCVHGLAFPLCERKVAEWGWMLRIREWCVFSLGHEEWCIFSGCWCPWIETPLFLTWSTVSKAMFC